MDVAATGIGVFAIVVLSMILMVAWVLLPFLLLRRLKAILRAIEELHTTVAQGMNRRGVT